MIRPVRRIGLYGYLGSGNLGNDASLEAVLTWLRSTGPEVELRGITIAPDELRARYGIASVPLHWSSRQAEDGRAGTAVRKVLGLLVDVPRSIRLAGSVDAVVVPGMGVLETGLGSRPWNLPLWQFLVAAACRLRRRPFVLLNVGADRAANPLTRWLYAATTNLAAHVSYRDQESADAMRESGSTAAAVVVPDVAFTHPAPTAADPEPGLVVVGAMAYYGYSDDPVRGAGVRRQYVATLAGALGRILDTGCRVELVGGDRVDVEIADDLRAAVLAARPGLREDLVVVRACTRFGELTELMSRAEVVVGSRFHNLICALRLGRPTISISYAGKCHHLMQQMGLADYSQDIEQLDADLLVDQVARARREAAVLTEQVRRATAAYPDRVATVLDHVAGETLGLERPRAAAPPDPGPPSEQARKVPAWQRT